MPFFYICMALVGKMPYFSTVVKSFLFQRDGGIAGYTWIIWVYIVCGILTPLLVKIPSNRIVIVSLPILICYELLCEYTQLSESRLLYYSIFTVIPYGLFMLYSVNYRIIPKKARITSCILIGIGHLIYTLVLFRVNGRYIPIGEYKYPARFYYFSYLF